MSIRNWKKYTFEFISIFVAVISAFALNNWNDNRREHRAEVKILQEIANGLEKDLEDIRINIQGHYSGLAAIDYWRSMINGQLAEANPDSVKQYMFDLTRDYISIQNTSGYETLKSRGLEILDNDSVRQEIIALYEYDYNTLRKFEEEYEEMQFFKNYYHPINDLLADHLIFDENGSIVGFELPLSLSESDKSRLLSYLWKIRTNRRFILYYYQSVEEKVRSMQELIRAEL